MPVEALDFQKSPTASPDDGACRRQNTQLAEGFKGKMLADEQVGPALYRRRAVGPRELDDQVDDLPLAHPAHGEFRKLAAR